jgi:rare lipoprotein A
MAAKTVRLALVLTAGASLSACASIEPRYATHPGGAAKAPPMTGGVSKVGKPYQVGGIWYVPREQPGYDQVGIASWYGEQFHLKATANGELFDMNTISAAHTTLPLPSIVEVTNLENGRRMQVRVNDRGPFVGNRIIDLSREAARELGYERQGVAKVRVRYVGPAPLLGRDAGVRYASATPPPRPPAALPSEPRVQFTAATPAEAAAIRMQVLPSLPSDPGALAATAEAVDVTGPLRIQAGAFTSEVNAERAVSRLAAAGNAYIEPYQRDGAVLYRVMLHAPSDEVQAYALRDRVAQIGFADARVVRSF